jgi:hypothetical protein
LKASEHAHARLLPKLSLRWTVLLPTETDRKFITAMTAVVLPFVTYLLTLRRISNVTTYRIDVNVSYFHRHPQQRAFLKTSSAFIV